MSTTWIQKSFAPFKRCTPTFLWKPIRSAATALATPIRFSYRSGHWRSSFANRAVDKVGEPLPWYTYPAIAFLQQRTYQNRDVLEFGAGQSTVWWSNRARTVLAVEQDADWVAELRGRVPKNVELLHAPISEGIEPVERAIIGRKFDLIVIDGHMRKELIDPAIRHMSPDGALLIDNSDGYDVAETLRSYPCQRVDFYGHVPGVIMPACTTIVFFDRSFLFKPEFPIVAH